MDDQHRKFRAVAQLGRAPRSGRGGRGFESLRPDHADFPTPLRTRLAEGAIKTLSYAGNKRRRR